jgi:hypothetical protein
VSPTAIPGIPYGPLPRTAAPEVRSALAWPPKLIVIHDTGNTGSATDEAHFAANRTDERKHWTSAHAYIDAGGAVGSSPLNLQAWGAFSFANANGIHLEMCGTNAGDPNAVPAATIARPARLTAQLCEAAGIPKVHLGPADVAAGKSGITGHFDITQGLHVGDHDDPGPNFDWSGFIALVNGDDVELTDKTHTLSVNPQGILVNDSEITIERLWQLILVVAAQARDAAQAKPGPVTLSDADRQDIANRVSAQLGAKLDAVATQLTSVQQQLAAAEHTLQP